MKKIVIILIAVAGVIAVLAIGKVAFDQLLSPKHRHYLSATPKEYLDLFTPAVQKQFSSPVTKNAKSGLPYSSVNYIYGEDRPEITLINFFKVHLKYDQPLADLVRINLAAGNPAPDKHFIDLINGDVQLKYKDDNADSVSLVNWNFSGNTFRLVRNVRNLLYYDIGFKNFTINYGGNTEIWAKMGDLGFSNRSAKVIFIKDHHTLYTLIFSEFSPSKARPDTTLAMLNPVFLK